MPLIGVSIRASQIACARVQAVNGIDTGLYSLFSEYDKVLLETYNLFFLDAGYGTGTLDMGQLISQTEYYADPVLSSGITRCEIQACASDGFRLASDRQGKAVEQQIIRYMKGNLGTAGIQKLKEKTEENQSIMEHQEQIEAQGMEEVDTENVVPMEGISLDNNPLEIVKSLRKNGILGLVLPEGSQVSEKEQVSGALLSQREIGQGPVSYTHLFLSVFCNRSITTLYQKGKTGRKFSFYCSHSVKCHALCRRFLLKNEEKYHSSMR